MLRRYLITGLLGAAVTFALFFLMQFLISRKSGELEEGIRGKVIEFVRLKRDSDLQLKQRQLPDKKPPEEPPPPPRLDMSRAPKPDPSLEGGAVLDFSLDLAGGLNLGAAPSDMDVIPLVRVNPQYPVRAAERGIQGWVEVEFTITAAGTVKEPMVIAAQPSGIFNRAALRAIRKWKYNPKVEDGVAVERSGVRVRLTFELEDS